MFHFRFRWRQYESNAVEKRKTVSTVSFRFRFRFVWRKSYSRRRRWHHSDVWAGSAYYMSQWGHTGRTLSTEPTQGGLYTRDLGQPRTVVVVAAAVAVVFAENSPSGTALYRATRARRRTIFYTVHWVQYTCRLLHGLVSPTTVTV